MTRRSDVLTNSRRNRSRKGLNVFAVLALAVCLNLSGFAVLTSVEHHLRLPRKSLTLQAAASSQKPPGQKGSAQKGQSGPTQRMGDWLATHQNLPLAQQEKALESDPNFKKLAPDRQNALRDRLRKFNSLTPDQRALALRRMNFWASLTRDQRQQLREANQRLQTLPEERRVAVHKALRHLRQMAPEQRQQVMQSDRFKSLFSDEEQGILKELATINPPGNGNGQHPAGPAAQSPKP